MLQLLKASTLSALIAMSQISIAAETKKPEGAGKQETFTVGITQIVEHPSLDEVRKGALDHLEKNGFKGKLEVEYLNAQGNMVTNSQIAKKLLGKRPDLIFAIGTPAAQAVVNKNRHTPVVFSPVSDPVGARLAKTWEKPGGIATGTSDKSPVLKQIQLIKELHPKTKKVAILYNPGESNSTSIVAQFKEACKQLDLIAEEGPVQNTAMVFTTASSVKADAIYVPTDNTVVSAIEAVIKAGVASQTPVFTAESESVAKGALASLAVNYYRLGEETGDMIANILNKKAKPSEMPVRFQKEFELHINPANAEKMGVTLSGDILKKAVVH